MYFQDVDYRLHLTQNNLPMQKIQEVSNITLEKFINEVLPAGKPLVIRGLVSDWPIVVAGKAGAQTFCDYIKKFDRGFEMDTMIGPASTKGRIFYNADLSGLNARMSRNKLATSLDYLLEHIDDDPSPLLALQSVKVAQYLPGLEQENMLLLLSREITPRIWIGGKVTVAAHYDISENIACCVAGKRKFTLFPPEQVHNLYIGPLELTPAGVAISMVDLENPDYSLYPKFKEALANAQEAILEPGDAVFIPYLWWHNVQSLEKFNALMNYWWGEPEERQNEPRHALYHAIMAISFLPENQKQAWRSMFDHYVFADKNSTSDHLPENRRGILGKAKPDDAIKKMRAALAKSLTRN